MPVEQKGKKDVETKAEDGNNKDRHTCGKCGLTEFIQ